MSGQPYQNSNWEEIGVLPDVPTPSDDAFPTAYRIALASFIASYKSTESVPYKQLLKESQDVLEKLTV